LPRGFVAQTIDLFGPSSKLGVARHQRFVTGTCPLRDFFQIIGW
jgi:hypothetical protein